MDCKEFKIWIDNATEEEIISVNAEATKHIQNCPDCKAIYSQLSAAYKLMDSQRKQSLSEFKSKMIIDQLKAGNYAQAGKTIKLISRFAAAAVIAIGLLTGILAGGILSQDNSNSSDPWETEFAMLSEDSGYNSYLFD